MMDLRSAARALDGSVTGRNSIVCPGPGHSRHDRSLSVTFDASAPDGFLCHSHASDDWQDCRDHVRQRLGLGGFQPAKPAEPVRIKPVHLVPDARTVSRIEFAVRIWKESRSILGTPAQGYLEGRGINLPPEAAQSSHALRFHPACPFRLESGETIRLPAMIGAMTNTETDEFQGIHRTALDPDGQGKAKVRGLAGGGKMMLGSARGACVKLSPDDEVSTGLGIAEGIETSLAVMGNFGWRPIWATLSAGSMRHFPVLNGIEALTLFADNDRSNSGQTAATECARRWYDAGREVLIITPPALHGDDPHRTSTDFNDLTGRAA